MYNGNLTNNQKLSICFWYRLFLDKLTLLPVAEQDAVKVVCRMIIFIIMQSKSIFFQTQTTSDVNQLGLMESLTKIRDIASRGNQILTTEILYLIQIMTCVENFRKKP